MWAADVSVKMSLLPIAFSGDETPTHGHYVWQSFRDLDIDAMSARQVWEKVRPAVFAGRIVRLNNWAGHCDICRSVPYRAVFGKNLPPILGLGCGPGNVHWWEQGRAEAA